MGIINPLNFRHFFTPRFEPGSPPACAKVFGNPICRTPRIVDQPRQRR